MKNEQDGDGGNDWWKKRDWEWSSKEWSQEPWPKRSKDEMTDEATHIFVEVPHVYHVIN